MSDDIKLIHFNMFCELFKQLEAICKSGHKNSKEANDTIYEMKKHYRFFNDSMIKYMDKFSLKLIECRYSFTQEKVKIEKTDEEAANITGEYKYANIINENEKGAIFNYNEHSVPLSKIQKEDFNILKEKTLKNIKFERHCLDTGKRPKIKTQQGSWSLPDSEKDW